MKSYEAKEKKFSGKIISVFRVDNRTKLEVLLDKKDKETENILKLSLPKIDLDIERGMLISGSYVPLYFNKITNYSLSSID